MAVRRVVVPPDADGMKTGLFLRRFLPALPESTLRKVFSARDVKLDGVRVSRDTPVKTGQELSVYLPAAAETESLQVIWEDDDILLVNKPAGISVEADDPGNLSLTDLCRIHVESRFSESGLFFEPAACHRLDNKTSGLCLFAKNEQALLILQEAFHLRTMEKYYTCLVRGIMKPPAAVCEAWLIKDAANAKVSILDHEIPGARPVITGYETLESGPVSRLRVHLVTGRTHQIRAHLAALGHPILGDDVYGDRSFNHQQKVRSLRLCATELTIRTGGRLPNLENSTFRINPPF